MQERRKYIRYDIEGSALVKTEDDATRNIQTDLVNIGFQGMSVLAREMITEGTIVKFELTTRLYDKPINGKGRVIYLKEMKGHSESVFRIGIEFIDIDAEGIQDILARIQEDICTELRKKEQSKSYSSKSRRF